MRGAKQIAAAGLPILFAPQAAQDSTFVYELSLIRDDNHVALYPVFWHRFDAAVMNLRSALKDGKLGRVQFLQLNRSVPLGSSSIPISQRDVDAELLHDADLLRWLIGDYNQVTGLRTAATNEGVMMQSVILAGRSLPEANWSIKPTDGPAEWKLIVRGEKAVAELHRDGTSRSWACDIAGTVVAGNEQNTARDLISAFASSVSQSSDSGSVSSDKGEVSTEWSELVKCFETIDATHRSVRRKRTIELHFEPMSERAIFKTQMTAIGCMMLVATFFLTLIYLGVASFVPPVSNATAFSNSSNNTSVDGERSPSSQHETANQPLPFIHRILIGLRMLVFAPLVIFLLAQILLPLTRPSSNERTLPP